MRRFERDLGNLKPPNNLVRIDGLAGLDDLKSGVDCSRSPALPSEIGRASLSELRQLGVREPKSFEQNAKLLLKFHDLSRDLALAFAMPLKIGVDCN